MTQAIIAVENLSKSYLVGHRTSDHHSYTALRDVLAREARNFARKTIDFARGRLIVQGDEIEEFWALKDVSFDLKQGEVLGIIGRNGAGKSTLLKILSRITEPTLGRVLLRGRVASLLEVGTGFHSELTGRENIFLNGAILGIDSKGDSYKVRRDCRAFAEVEKFLDTPVKRYSSGMYVRLAFAVAAHLEPDILIVDEVLAVGDSEFQKKCLGKMDNISRQQGKAIIFVSHDLAAIGEMTRRTVLLESGKVVLDGPTSDAISAYLSKGLNTAAYESSPHKTTTTPYISRAEVITSDLNGIHQFGEPLEVKFWIKHLRPMPRACFSFQIVNQFHRAVAHAWAFYPDVRFGNLEGESQLTCRFPSIKLNVGRYCCGLI